jgi:hypothetical protein
VVAFARPVTIENAKQRKKYLMSESLTPTERVHAAESREMAWKRRYSNMQKGSEIFAERLTGGVMCIGGGVFTGAIWSKFGTGLPGSAKFGNTQIEIDTTLGLLALVAAAVGAAGKHSAELATFGGGMLAARAAAFVGKVMEEQEQKRAAG